MLSVHTGVAHHIHGEASTTCPSDRALLKGSYTLPGTGERPVQDIKPIGLTGMWKLADDS